VKASQHFRYKVVRIVPSMLRSMAAAYGPVDELEPEPAGKKVADLLTG
jgi:hypothetical protein